MEIKSYRRERHAVVAAEFFAAPHPTGGRAIRPRRGDTLIQGRLQLVRTGLQLSEVRDRCRHLTLRHHAVRQAEYQRCHLRRVFVTLRRRLAIVPVIHVVAHGGQVDIGDLKVLRRKLWEYRRRYEWVVDTVVAL